MSAENNTQFEVQPFSFLGEQKGIVIVTTDGNSDFDLERFENIESALRDTESGKQDIQFTKIVGYGLSAGFIGAGIYVVAVDKTADLTQTKIVFDALGIAFAGFGIGMLKLSTSDARRRTKIINEKIEAIKKFASTR